MTESRALPVPDGLDGVRVDQALGRLLGFSRTRAAEVADAGGVRLDGQVLGKGDRLRASGMLLVEWDEAPRPGLEVVPQDAPGLALAHQDDDLVVVDKPIGVAAHPAPGWTGPTVLGALASMGVPVATSGPAERAGIVHRLDAGTSGLMVVAKREQAYTMLKRAFRDRTVQKVYHAVVQGHPDPTVGTIDAPIGRHPKQEFRFAVTADGKPSVTHYRVLEAFRGASLLEIELETGRTHQIRVHMAAQRHPCAGDTMYGADPTLAARLGLTRQWLHAMRLGFAHPATGEWLETTSEYPDDLRTALERLTD